MMNGDMDNEVKEWLEEQYREFESQSFIFPSRVWRSPVYSLKGTVLYELFEKFAPKFPDHPSETNTVFYLIEAVNCSPVHFDVWLWCSHFEHAALEDLRNLVSFIEHALGELFTTDDIAFVDELDNTRERVVLSFHHPKESIVELLKDRGVCVKPM